MFEAGNDNDNDRGDKIIFTIKDTKLYVPVVTLSARDNKNLSKLLSIGFERYKTKMNINMNIKQRVRTKIQQMNLDIFSNQILLESIDCLFYFIQIKMTMLKDLKLKDIIYQKA